MIDVDKARSNRDTYVKRLKCATISIATVIFIAAIGQILWVNFATDLPTTWPTT